MDMSSEHRNPGSGAEGKHFFPRINYREHPAFRGLDVPLRPDEQKVDAAIAEIDASLENLARTTGLSEEELVQGFRRGPQQKIDALRAYLAETTPGPRLTTWLSRSFDDVSDDLLDEARVANVRGTAEVPHHDASAVKVFGDLKRDGAHICRLDDRTLGALRQICAPDMEWLRERAKQNPNTRVVKNFEPYAKTGRLLHRFFRKNGILKGLSGYVGSNVNFVGFALEYSYAGQNWWKGCYDDVGIADSKTTYMHYDHGCRDPKAIIALSEVSDQSGPTSYVLGSHARERSRFLHSLIKSMDQHFEEISPQSSGRSYYRSRFSDPAFRREFLLLPTALQGCSHFGEDVVDGSSLSRELLENEVKITNDVGNCVVFDGNYGIHRGANVQSGERFAFQVVFLVEPRLSISQKAQRLARGLALSVLRGQH